MKGITGFGCTGSAMGSLFYRQLGLHPGGSVVPPSDAKVGPFTNVQPYLYWACTGETAASPCQASGPANGFEWNFSFGNGFQGTNLMGNNLFVIVYYPDVPPDNQRLNRNLLFPPFATNASIVRAQIPWTAHFELERVCEYVWRGSARSIERFRQAFQFSILAAT
jgi:hypothetical protein